MNQLGQGVTLVFDDRTPIYRQIADHIVRDVISGVLGEEEQVMSTNQYATFHRINPATAAKAFQSLVDQGILYKRRGVGMFVMSGAAARLRDERRAGFAERSILPMVEEAIRLGLSLDELIEAVRTHYAHAALGLQRSADHAPAEPDTSDGVHR